MSFRLRLILAFAGLALVQALLFATLSDQLIRDGLEGEANARLGMITSLLPSPAPAHDWPLEAPAAGAATAAWRQALAAYAKHYDLSRATLLWGTKALDSQAAAAPEAAVWWHGDALSEPKAIGMVKVSGPLYKASDGWRKVLYAKLDPNADAWLRVEAGTPFLGQVAALQKRLWRLSAVLALPSLLAGLALGWALSRRARALAQRLRNPEQGVRLTGRDEFAAIGAQAQDLLDSLALQRARGERLDQARLRLAHDLSRGVAHELRNPLASLSLLTDVLLRRQREGAPLPELEELASRLQSEVGRLEHTVARFMEFARQPEMSPRRVELKALAREAAHGLAPAPLLKGEAQADADPQAVALVLGVLLTNAMEAAGPQGQVTLHLNQMPEEAVVHVWDSGPAVDAEAQAKLFTPFFTTKPKGLGLGLATAASLADHMGGSLSLLADAKTFQLTLPKGA